jgi:epoxyqueuosine reductase QueG
MSNERLKSKVWNFLNSEGFPLMGIAGVRSLPNVPDAYSPQTILKEARSIVCYGVPIPKGIIYAERDALLLYWRYWNVTYRSLDAMTDKLCLMLEGKGHRAVPVYGCYPMKVFNREFWGVLPLIYWAELAGLGRLSKCGLLVHPKFGMRLALGGIVTTTPLTPTEKMKNEVCPPECSDCLDICPVNAIAKTGKVNHNSCMRYANANPLVQHLLKDPPTKDKYSFETINNVIGVDDHSSYACFECLKACPLNDVY